MAMKLIETVVDVSEERIVTLRFPDDVSPGRHHVVIVIEEPAISPDSLLGSFPILPDANWTDDMHMRREDLYGDDGR